MFYETTQTIGPGWHRSYKTPVYKEMSWSPSSRNFRSPGSSPETYRRVIKTEEDFPSRTNQEPNDDEFFNREGRRSPTFPRRIFKEVWNDAAPSSNHRFPDRPRMFKRVFKPTHWEDEVPNLRRAEFDRKFDDAERNSSRNFDEDFDRPPSRRFDEDFDRRFNIQKDVEDEFGKSEGRVHHIPIMVEKRIEEMKSRFGKNMDSPSDNKTNEDEYSEDWDGPQVQRLRKTFEPKQDGFSARHNRSPRSRAFANSIPETWDPHAVHTLPTRKVHKSSQSFDDSKHPVPPKYVFRSSSETHEDMAKPEQPHSAAFRSHSDGHCPNQTYVTKIEVNMPNSSKKDAKSQQDPENGEKQQRSENPTSNQTSNQKTSEDAPKPKPSRGKYDSPALQQIAVVLQNVEDLVVRVEGYNGRGRDKQYRFLDEMLTRCMLRLDDVDTENREDIRNARKAALRQVQSCIDRLEAKADESERRHSENKQAIPPKEQEIEENKESSPSKEVPMEEEAKEADPHQAIPMGGVEEAVPQVIPLGGVSNAIPLGYTPITDGQKGQDGKNTSVVHAENGEQTKL
ncbi:hypothetical protein JTE90_002285 [Oedothorax gibbosus]|uniref:BAG domain-containing protein n=1 Tax=Oedothorax gibbosus TaxID=931172 RepID=A0AAV6U944_9ARAC|nr:hypothetical protein JTE90_002285 [Oedothorax gibbosus]